VSIDFPNKEGVDMTQEEYSSKNLDHLGIVSTICDEINLVQTIDRHIPSDSRALLTTGECVKLMVLNGLGFTSKPLYLEAEFFRSRPVERFLGRSIEVDEITDDRLGLCLDRCFKGNCSQIFGLVATKAADRFAVDTRFRHLDSTSVSVQGEYNTEDGIGLMQLGHSKDHRPDLKQFMISLICSQDGDVPLLAKTIAGNTSDQTDFGNTLANIKDQLKESEAPCYYVADSALYTEKNLIKISSSVLWISRVPERIAAAKRLIWNVHKERMKDVGGGYFCEEFGSIYAGVKQRWILVYSEAAFCREKKTLDRNIIKEEQLVKKDLKTLSSQLFSCENDAHKSIADKQKKYKYHQFTNIEVVAINTKNGRGRPKKNEEIKKVYKITGQVQKEEAKIKLAIQSKGKFIIASNELDHSAH